MTNPSGFLYDGPYPRAEPDYAAEARIYSSERREERRRVRQAEWDASIAVNPPLYPFANLSSQPQPSTGYGMSMGNGGVGTLGYLGIPPAGQRRQQDQEDADQGENGD